MTTLPLSSSCLDGSCIDVTCRCKRGAFNGSAQTAQMSYPFNPFNSYQPNADFTSYMSATQPTSTAWYPTADHRFTMNRFGGPTLNFNLSASSLGSLASKSSRKRRNLFTSQQTQQLEQHFKSHKYVNSQDRENLARSIGLTAQQVKIWFQNQRYKHKRQEKERGMGGESRDEDEGASGGSDSPSSHRSEPESESPSLKLKPEPTKSDLDEMKPAPFSSMPTSFNESLPDINGALYSQMYSANGYNPQGLTFAFSGNPAYGQPYGYQNYPNFNMNMNMKL